ncbi:MAG: DUF2116 family Zn-ribbon domain-containing protein [Archaeoglobaceae archaeon]
MALIPHRHCVVCGKAIELEKFFCSEECENKMAKERKRQRNFTIFMFLMLILLLLLLWIPYIR